MARNAKVGLTTVLFSGSLLLVCVLFHQGCSDQIIGLDASLESTRQANESIDQQIRRLTETNDAAVDGPTVQLRPQDAGDTLSMGSSKDSVVSDLPGKRLGLNLVKDTVRQYRPGLENEIKVTVTRNGSDTAMINSLGGTIDLTGLSRAKFTIPASAFSGQRRITVESGSSLTEELLIQEFNFGPDGLVFDKAAELELPDSNMTSVYGVLPKVGTWFYYNEISHAWEFDQTVHVVDGSFHVILNHFSTYRLVVTPVIGLSQGGQE